MPETIHILPKDKMWLEARIADLHKQIQDLGPNFYEVFNQSSETWHDNAPFDALRDKQSVLFAEYSNLKSIRQKSSLSVPKPGRETVGYGSVITINTKTYLISGDWTPYAGQLVDGVFVISAQSPLAKAVFGKKVGAITSFGTLESVT